MDTLEAWIEGLRHAVDDHDLDAVVSHFATEYVNETPVHPARAFIGRDQVRENWGRIFAGVPDIRATVTSSLARGDTIWSEWEMAGTRVDGAAHLMRGVIVFRVLDGEATHARFYLEPVDDRPDGVSTAVGRLVGEESAR